uniref:C-C motif chemokine n=1 Tax=Loxodonta africana TaxID=9785 RepID=G3T244_LOXAF
MKVSVAALFILLFNLVLGFQDSSQTSESVVQRKIWPLYGSLPSAGFHRPSDCCITYTARNIRCAFVDHYFETSSGCSQPGVIFITKKGQRVCANPLIKHVQDCVNNLK